MQTRISEDTARTAAELLRTMGKTGSLPKTEANAAAAILRSAAKPNGPETTRPKATGLLTTAQVATRLNCSRRSVFRMADDGVLTRRFLRPGNAKSLRFIEAEVMALCEAGGDSREDR
jgi:excisionase family DNA binding protein